MIRLVVAALVTTGALAAGIAASAPAPVAVKCPAGVPVSQDGTCGLSWDDIRNQPVYTQGKP